MSPLNVAPLFLTKHWVTPNKSEVTVRRLSSFGEGEAISTTEMRERDLVRKSPRRERRILYSSGDDSWDERRPSRRSESLAVPESRSRSHSHSKSPRRYPEYEYERSPRPERLRSSRRRSPSVNKTPILDKFGLSVREEMEKTRYKSRHGSSSSRKSPRVEGSRREKKVSEDTCYISPRSYNTPISRSPRKSQARTPPRSPRRSEAPAPAPERSPRRQSSRYRERERYDHRYFESQTESSEDWREEQRKQSRKYVEEQRKVSSSRKESKPTRREEEDHDYVNYSPSRGPKIQDTEVSASPWGQKSPRDRISAMEEIVDTESTNIIINEELEKESEDSPAPDFMFNIQDIMVKPAEEFMIPQIKDSTLLDMNEDSNKFLTLKEDEKDSCLGLSFSDLNSEQELIKRDDFVLTVDPPAAPKQWSLFSFSPDGQFQVRDEETGEIFFIYNQQPEPEPVMSETSETEQDKDGEEEISWCSLYLCSKIFGLILMCGGLAAMVVVAIQ